MVDVPQFLILILTSISMYLQFQQLNFSAGLTLGALLGGLIGAIFTGSISMLRDYYENKRKRHNDKIQYRRNIKEKKIKLYSLIRSKKYLIKQLFVSVASYTIYIDNNNALSDWLNSSKYKDTPFAKQQIEKFAAEDLDLRNRLDHGLIDLAKARERIVVDIGLVEILFNDPRLTTFISTIETSETAIDNFIENSPIEIANGQFDVEVSPRYQINPIWQTKKLNELKTLDLRLNTAIDKLVDEMKKML